VVWTQEVVEVEEHMVQMKQVGVVEVLVLVLLKSIQVILRMVTLCLV
jgi:hypothetical protein